MVNQPFTVTAPPRIGRHSESVSQYTFAPAGQYGSVIYATLEPSDTSIAIQLIDARHFCEADAISIQMWGIADSLAHQIVVDRNTIDAGIESLRYIAPIIFPGSPAIFRLENLMPYEVFWSLLIAYVQLDVEAAREQVERRYVR